MRYRRRRRRCYHTILNGANHYEQKVRNFLSAMYHSIGLRSVEDYLQVEYPPCTCKVEQPNGQVLGALHPVNAKLLREFWTLKEAKLPPGSTVPQEGLFNTVHEQGYWGRAPLHSSRLSRSVSAQEFYTEAVERCVRAGRLSGKGDGRVRHGRQSVAAALFTGAQPPPGPPSSLSFPQIIKSDSSGATTNACSENLPVTSCHTREGEGECKQHGGRYEAMDRRVRGGRLLRSQSKDPHFASFSSRVMSILDTAPAADPPISLNTLTTTASYSPADDHDQPHTHDQRAEEHVMNGESRDSSRAAGQPLGMSLSRLYSLDSAALHQLDRALFGACEQSPGAASLTSPVAMEPAPASAPSGLGGLIYKVRPLGAAASSLSLHSACPLGSPFSRCNSTLLDFAEEQASLAAAQQGLCNQMEYLTLLSARNSLGGGCGGGGNAASYQSSAAGSLNASPNPHQPHVSLAAMLSAAAASNGGNRVSSGGNSGGGRSLQMQSSLPADVGRRGGPALAAPDMRFFPFSSPEDFYMAATVLLDAKLPGVLPEEGSSSPPKKGAPPCR
ncbi:hypothetical protein VaNZ11_005753 [Volvox africanus]|uniref:Uncharacterized protein n=1 Tax=Volvox africanus TaxID=51714 RepID=A0ABQ5S0H2_9CHLO|nr:hypothetical protein VaNZ11_005753 [Volvox africanus]